MRALIIIYTITAIPIKTNEDHIIAKKIVPIVKENIGAFGWYRLQKNRKTNISTNANEIL